MIQIRQNIFETNSSSTHSLIICDPEEFDEWEKNEDILLILDYPSDLPPEYLNLVKDKTFITKENADIICKQTPSYWNFEDMFCSFNEYFYSHDYYYPLYDYTEQIEVDGKQKVAFGKFGYEG